LLLSTLFGKVVEEKATEETQRISGSHEPKVRFRPRMTLHPLARALLALHSESQANNQRVVELSRLEAWS
jgi:hypothetical protein